MVTIFELNNAIVKIFRHGNSTAGEVGVVVESLADLNTSRRVNVTGQKGEDIILKS